MARLTAADGWIVIVAERDASNASEHSHVARTAPGPPRPLFTGFDAAYDFIEATGPSTELGAGERLFFRTTKDAPLGRIVSIDPGPHPARLREVVPQSAHRPSKARLGAAPALRTYLPKPSDRP